MAHRFPPTTRLGHQLRGDAGHPGPPAPPPRPGERPHEVLRWVVQFGGCVASSLLDPAYHLFRAPGIEGVIGYRTTRGAAVAVGDPVCAPDDVMRLMLAFRAFCRQQQWATVYAAASESFARQAIEASAAGVAFGEEVVLDPQRDPQHGADGGPLRQRIHRARREGIVVVEYRRTEARNPRLEPKVQDLAGAWLGGRHGLQIYTSHVDVFGHATAKRWFYATHGDDVVGALILLRMERSQGYLFDFLMTTPSAAPGTSEILVVAALDQLRLEGCRFATFGVATTPGLAPPQGFGRLSTVLARWVFRAACDAFHLEGRLRFREKFQPVRADPSYLLFDPPYLSWRALLALMQTFNVSFAHRRRTARSLPDEAGHGSAVG